MGQRHQLFAIAKVGNRYRSLSALHHQWLYGLTALKTCLRLVKVFQDPGNRYLLKLELARAATLDSSVWELETSWHDIRPKFPYVLTCMLIGTSVDVETGYSNAATLEPWNMECDGGDNNDGITILDITDLDHVRYCFVPGSEPGAENSIGSEEPMIYTAREYLNDYYKELAPEMKEVLALLETVPLVQTASLNETWPRDWVDRDDLKTDTRLDSPDPALGYDNDLLVGSLTQLSLKKTIEEILDESEEQADLTMDQVEVLPIFLPALRSYLRLHPSVVSDRSCGFTLLRRAFSDCTELDLGIFPDLTGEQVVELCADKDKLVLLDLSGNHNIEVGHLKKILAATPITKLYVWNNHRLPLCDVAALVGPKLQQVFHREMFLAAHGEIWGGRLEESTQAISAAHSTYEKKHNMVQLISLTADTSCVAPNGDGNELFGPDCMAMSPQAYRFDRKDFKLVALPLDDMNCSSSAVLVAVSRVIRFLSQHDHLYESDLASLSLIMALRNPESHRTIDYLPKEAWRVGQMLKHWQHPDPRGISSLLAEKWTIVLVQEPSVFRFRLAFLRNTSDGHTQVCSVEDIMKQIDGNGLKNTWDKEIAMARYPGYNYNGRVKEPGDVEVVPCDEATALNVMALIEKLKAGAQKEV
ncbi:hypothetical protein K491DRAFT_718793 [Lophiostoma macrostomum CBS 122681]|uniref:Uncharacterized protein n=1 Tax=Lophiostoma macrostomum CBS 122681 TaxID=1314788 RepID=A0A6A6SY08_9PLEO|nr:hypothetical protein K491DRAFT_718793 [Lophiostoma macrostomum CBS 122681]